MEDLGHNEERMNNAWKNKSDAMLQATLLTVLRKGPKNSPIVDEICKELESRGIKIQSK